jgi:hypothetical protein
MLNFAKLPIVVAALVLYGYVPLAASDTNVNSKLATALEDSMPSLVMAEDFRAASNVAMQLAAARSRLGETNAACAALQQSLENYRKAIAKESGETETASSHINDDSEGMAEVRAKYGCARA